MGSYSIRQLAALTGIKAHTLRVWEQRYRVIEPHRTATNIRYYDDEHLKRLLSISTLVNHGIRISEACQLSEKEMRSRIEGMQCTEHHLYDDFINGFMIAMIDMDEKKFNKVYNGCLCEHKFEDIVLNVFYPFLTKVGIMWGMNEISPAQEHFATNLIRRKMISATNEIKLKNSGDTYLLFLPTGEMHEIGLLFVEYILKNKGHKVIYLGQMVPWQDVQAVCEQLEPDFLYTFFITNSGVINIDDYLKQLAKLPFKKGILISGRPELLEHINLPKKVNWLKSAQEAASFIA